MKQGKFKNLITFGIAISMMSCTNPLGRGTWTPLPFKKKQILNAPADSTKMKVEKNK
ncbi:MAG TPA: hypothetical protein PLI47_00310 [Bacteroidia bacterium]|jgi:competence transcription factor ComK|nr:hypothetical protein [Bacteroidota bacterium]MBP9924187.1 hypothetical protein [Bacteroidia bacterium]MBK7431434.1 hypothetical protein [Bacteroidota bacterium]MBK7571837.1 hypothetical protein [Bacteroidota bacterium]HQV98688.1 hypothetical protein [Bacteroidia bacterium]